MQLHFLNPKTEWEEIARIWTAFTASGAPSYFLSWGWMSTWVRSLPEETNVRLAVFEDEEGPVMAAFLGHGGVARRKVFRSRAYLLNETGDRTYDQVYTEYNSFLTRPNARPQVEEVLQLLPGKWDELCLSGLDTEHFPGCCLPPRAAGCRLYVVNRIPAPYVDLGAIAEGGGDYMASLSGNTRAQIRRAYKLYRERGAVKTVAAEDLETARAFYSEMKVLHARAWRRKGKPGAFANQWFDAFHQRLIEERFRHGEIQLLHTTCGEETIGLLYNFVLNGRVYYYQAGFSFDADNRLKPGYVCHAEAISHNLRLRHQRYDFLAGFEDYKERLSTGTDNLMWVRLQKPRPGFAIENAARDVALWLLKRYESRQRRSPRRPPTERRLDQAA